LREAGNQLSSWGRDKLELARVEAGWKIAGIGIGRISQ
jgi:hypothetical protein